MNLVPAIDVHGHYGMSTQEGITDLHRQFMSADAKAVAARARAVGIEWTIASPLLGLFPRGKADAVAGNEEAARVIPKVKGLRQWVIVNPRQPATYDQARTMLKSPSCMGIKIHPEEHRYPIRKFGRTFFEFAAEHRAVVLTHTGEKNSWPIDFIPFANEYPEVTLILAHLGHGCGQADLQVRAIQASQHGNVFVDTSSAQSIFPGLIEWAVGEIGAERILFGTDTPLYSASMQRARIDHAVLTAGQKRKILRENALKLFGGKL